MYIYRSLFLLIRHCQEINKTIKEVLVFTTVNKRLFNFIVMQLMSTNMCCKVQVIHVLIVVTVVLTDKSYVNC